MAFGMAFNTTNGMKDLTVERAARLVGIVQYSTTSGSASAPSGWDNANGFFYVIVRDDKLQPDVSASGSTITWTEAGAVSDASSDFKIIYMAYK